jgi:DNA-binding transcriptional regulator YhcF (GntR family)
MQYDLIIDIALTPVKNTGAKIVLLALATYSNAEGECFPSQQKLASDTGLTDRTVRSAIKWLADHGYITVSARSNTSNLYVITSMKESDMNHEEKSSSEVDSNITQLSMVKSSKANTTSAETISHPNNTPAFQTFWSAYPRRIGKGAARTAFKKALKFSSANEILKGATAYAAHCEEMGTEKQYIPHPSTWLNGERWDDDLESEKTETKKTIGWLNEL